MTRIAYVNGRYLPQRHATVSIEDRGYQFADGVYEVIAFFNRHLLDGDLHLARLARSLRELQIAPPMSDAAFACVLHELIARNPREDGTVYIQISRGVARRDHPFPSLCAPSVAMNVTGAKMPKPHEVAEGVSVILLPEQRWARRDIKSISLLPNVLAKQAALQAGAREAWLVDEAGIIGEGAVSNNAIVTREGVLVTHPLGQAILGGVTRQIVLRLARQAGITVEERPFHRDEAVQAGEAMLMSTTSNILPVVRLGDAIIGDGAPGPVTRRLLALYYAHIQHQTGKSWPT